MGGNIELTASDGHVLGAYRADPAGAPRGTIVVLQEIFGVNNHIRSICDRLAGSGYVAIAPALFDRFRRDFETGYSPDEVTAARALATEMVPEETARDVDAAIDAAAAAAPPVAMVGFCLGGSLAFAAATRRNDLAAAVCFYGGKIAAMADKKPLCPTQMHFGELDHAIPVSDVEAIKGKRTDCDIHVYADAQHGFNCDARASYHPESAAIAWSRTMSWLETHMK